MPIPTDRRYLQTHEWHKPEGDTITIGITQFAADELTDVTYVKLPKVGSTIDANKPFGEIESVKATSDLYSGVSGTVIAINEKLTDDPALVNREPHEEGWMIKVKASDSSAIDKLLSVEAYLKRIGQ